MSEIPAQIELFALSKKITFGCYELTMDLKEDEKTNFSRYIRRASLDLHINIALLVFAKPKKRKKLLGSALNSIVIIETAAGILSELDLVSKENVHELLKLTSGCERQIREIYLNNKASDNS